MSNQQGKLLMSWTALKKVFARLFGYDIFISYRRADGTRYAIALQEELSKQFLVFRDETDIDYGEKFPALLRQRISRCQMVVVVVTKGALEADSWVLKEVAMRSDACRRRFFGLFPKKLRIVPVYFDGILPESIQGSDPAITVLRESNGEQADGDAWDASETCQYVARTFGTLRLSRKIMLTAFASFFGVLLMAIAMLIAGTSPFYWEQLHRPLANSEYDERWLLPIRDVAVSKTDPGHVLYLGEVSIYVEETDSEQHVPTLLSTRPEVEVSVAGVVVSQISSLDEVKRCLEADDGWVTTSTDATESHENNWDLPLDREFGPASDSEKAKILGTRLKEAFPSASDIDQLASMLTSLYWNSGFSELRYTKHQATDWTLEVFYYHWWEPVQGHYMGNEESSEVVVRFGNNGTWVLIDIDDIIGIWPIGATPDSALLLTSKNGFFSTKNCGASWESANFGESGFNDGPSVKPVLAGDEIFAFIDRGHKDNPFFRLRKRGFLERIRVGLIRILLGGDDGQGQPSPELLP